ncbi:MAG: cytochrome P450 [Caldilinea sp. CFX5]|nr:cytochrome P450 [Caldilinea sp. CFX5]
MTTMTLERPAQKQPPLLRGLPIIGNLIPLSHDILGFVQQAVREHEDLVEVKLMGASFYIATHPAVIEEVLVTKNHHFIKDKGLREFAKPVFGRGLLTSDGDFWLRQRRLAQPAFHRQRIAAYGEVMTNFTERTLAHWRDGEVHDIHEAMMKLTLEVVAKTLFDQEDNAEVADIGLALDAIMARFDNNSYLSMIENVVQRPLPTPTQRRYKQAVRRLDAIVSGVSAQRRAQNEDKGDLLGMFLAARDEDGNGMSDQQLLDECKTMFLAGHETTALTLSWTLWLLDRHPAVKAKLQTELAQVLAGRTPTLADLPKLPYTERVILESMRLYPPAWTIQREATSDVVIGGYMIPKGSDVLISQYGVQRDPRWYPDPERFDPDRWENDLLKQLPKYAYFPFGGGPRLCIGQQFAQMEAALMLATIVQRFDLTLVRGQKIVPQPSITMRPRYGLKMRVKRLI